MFLISSISIVNFKQVDVYWEISSQARNKYLSNSGNLKECGVFEFELLFHSFKLFSYPQFPNRIFNPNTWKIKRCDNMTYDVVVRRHPVVRWLGALSGGFD